MKKILNKLLRHRASVGVGGGISSGRGEGPMGRERASPISTHQLPRVSKEDLEDFISVTRNRLVWLFAEHCFQHDMHPDDLDMATFDVVAAFYEEYYEEFRLG